MHCWVATVALIKWALDYVLIKDKKFVTFFFDYLQLQFIPSLRMTYGIVY